MNIWGELPKQHLQLKCHTAALGNSSSIIQDNCGSCNPVLVMSLRVEFQYHVFPSTIFQYSNEDITLNDLLAAPEEEGEEEEEKEEEEEEEEGEEEEGEKEDML